MMRTRGSRSRSRSAISSELSGEPSLTNTISYDDEIAEIALTVRL
jgi:hypothetical protein